MLQVQTQPTIHKLTFVKEVMDTVHFARCGFIDAVLAVCEKNNIDPERAKNLIDSQIKDRMEAEYVEKRMLTKEPTLL